MTKKGVDGGDSGDDDIRVGGMDGPQWQIYSPVLNPSWRCYGCMLELKLPRLRAILELSWTYQGTPPEPIIRSMLTYITQCGHVQPDEASWYLIWPPCGAFESWVVEHGLVPM